MGTAERIFYDVIFACAWPHGELPQGKTRFW